ncbi:MAG: transporter [Luteolibacter sp.]
MTQLPYPTNVSLGLIAGFLIPALASADSLRPLSTDRPDTTESPHTVDCGHFQIEMEVANLQRDGGNSASNFAEINAKIGLARNTDLQFVLPAFTHEESGSEGFGDMELRLKQNLWGNDDGPTALALMPFIKLPTASGDLGNGEVEGGLIVPFGFEGPAGWSCAVMAEIDLELDEDGSGYHPVLLSSVTTSHALSEQTAAFFELVGIFNTDSASETEAYFNTGCTWAPFDTFQFDGGIRIGLTDASTDVTPFLGMSVKL